MARDLPRACDVRFDAQTRCQKKLKSGVGAPQPDVDWVGRRSKALRTRYRLRGDNDETRRRPLILIPKAAVLAHKHSLVRNPTVRKQKKRSRRISF